MKKHYMEMDSLNFYISLKNRNVSETNVRTDTRIEIEINQVKTWLSVKGAHKQSYFRSYREHKNVHVKSYVSQLSAITTSFHSV